jgi:hypothetical protein
MDAVYIFAHSSHADSELRYSLRSVAEAAPWLRKVWIFGDRPDWLSTDTTIVQQVPHEAMAKLGRWKVPLHH